MLALLLGAVLVSCSKEELVGPAVGTTRATDEHPVGTMEDMNALRGTDGTLLRAVDLDGDGTPDEQGISDDGNDDGDSERNRKVKN